MRHNGNPIEVLDGVSVKVGHDTYWAIELRRHKDRKQFGFVLLNPEIQQGVATPWLSKEECLEKIEKLQRELAYLHAVLEDYTEKNDGNS